MYWVFHMMKKILELKQKFGIWKREPTNLSGQHWKMVIIDMELDYTPWTSISAADNFSLQIP